MPLTTFKALETTPSTFESIYGLMSHVRERARMHVRASSALAVACSVDSSLTFIAAIPQGDAGAPLTAAVCQYEASMAHIRGGIGGTTCVHVHDQASVRASSRCSCFTDLREGHEIFQGDT